MAMQVFVLTSMVLIIELDLAENRAIIDIAIGTSILNYVNLAFFFHRIWMLFYKSLMQKSLEDFDISNVAQRRASKSLDNLWINQRHRIGNSRFMSVIWFIICCAFSILLKYLQITCVKECGREKYWPHYDFLNFIASGLVVIFGLSMLFIQK